MKKQDVEKIVSNKLKETELSSLNQEIADLRSENKVLLTKLSSVEETEENEAPASETPASETPVEENLEQVIEETKNVVEDNNEGDEVSEVAEVLQKVVELEESVGEFMEESRRQLSEICKACNIKPMTRQDVAYTKTADTDLEKEMVDLFNKMKSAKSDEDIEAVKKALKEFITSNRKTKLSEDESATLEEYKELGTVEEIKQAVEVLETYVDTVGTLPEVQEQLGVLGDEELPSAEAPVDETSEAPASEYTEGVLSSKVKPAFKKVVKPVNKANVKNSNKLKRSELIKRAMRLSSLKQEVKSKFTTLSSRQSAKSEDDHSLDTLALRMFNRKNR